MLELLTNFLLTLITHKNCKLETTMLCAKTFLQEDTNSSRNIVLQSYNYSKCHCYEKHP